MADNLPDPANREESYLANIAGATGVELPDAPRSRKEQYLAYIAENGGGGGGTAWGQITGTLSNQTDLQTALDGKVDQYETLPTATAALEGEIAQYAGAGSVDYTTGYFYECESTHLRAASAVVTRGTITNPTFDRHRLQTLGLQQGVYDFAVISSKWNIKQNGTYTEIEGGDDLTQIALLGITYTGTAGEGARILVAITGGTDAYEAAGSTITFNQATMDAAFNNTTGALLLTYVNDATYGLGWQPVHHDNLVPTSDPRLDPATLGANLVNTPNEGDYLAIHYKMNDPVYDWTQIDVQPAGSSTTEWGDITGTLADQTDLATALNAKQTTANLVTSVSASSTDTQYPSAKLLYDTVGNVETLITTLVSGGGAQ